MLTAAVLVLFTFLCITLSDDFAWDNVTRAARNALVFQGRHQGYGAYVLRRDYERRFIIAFFASVGLLGGSIAVLRFLTPVTVESPVVVQRVVDRVMDKIIDLPTDPKPPLPNKAVTPPTPTPKPTPTPQSTGPVEATDSVVTRSIVEDTSTVAVLPPGGTPGGKGLPKGPAGTEPKDGFEPPVEPFSPVDVERIPEFPGSETAMFIWVKKNVRFPEDLGEKDKVYVQFVVELDGSVSNVVAVKGKYDAYKREAERLVRNMPKWTAARMNKHDVRCRLVLPISFETR